MCDIISAKESLVCEIYIKTSKPGGATLLISAANGFSFTTLAIPPLPVQQIHVATYLTPSPHLFATMASKFPTK